MKAIDAAGRAKCVFDVSDFVVLLLVFLRLKIFSLFEAYPSPL